MNSTDFEHSLTRALHDLTPEPPEIIGAASLVGADPARRRAYRPVRRRQWLAVGLAACIVAIVGVTAALVTGSGPTAHRPPAAAAPTGARPPSGPDRSPAAPSPSARESALASQVQAAQRAAAARLRACGAGVGATLTIRDHPITIDVTLHNRGGRACRLTGAPQVRFVARHFDIATTFHPGRPALPTSLPAGGRARFRVTVIVRNTKPTSEKWAVTVQVGSAPAQRLLPPPPPPSLPDHGVFVTGLVYLGR